MRICHPINFNHHDYYLVYACVSESKGFVIFKIPKPIDVYLAFTLKAGFNTTQYYNVNIAGTSNTGGIDIINEAVSIHIDFSIDSKEEFYILSEEEVMKHVLMETI